jgi:trimeric autotransporter adhesin
MRSAYSTLIAVGLLTTVGIAQVDINQPHVAHGRPRAASEPEQIQGSSPHTGIAALPALAQARISAAIGEDERAYHLLERSSVLRMDNPNHAVSATFTATGVEFARGTNRWTLALSGYGRGDSLHPTHAAGPSGRANRVEYQRGALTEWYVNGPIGLEQGFTLERAPADANGGPVTLAFRVSGNLTASLDPGARSVTLRKDGKSALRYGGLIAVDADGREYRSWLEVADNELRLRVDDTGARYPLIIDPYIQTPKLTTVKPCDSAGVCDDGAIGDEFGYSVSISADAGTVVIGTPFKYTNSFTRGAAYVFLRPTDGNGWNSVYPNFFKTKLLASDGPTNGGLYLGYSVAISRDGGTIVAGARKFGTGSGAAYVFVRPANGWDSNQVQTQTAKLTPAPVANGSDQGSFGHDVSISGDGATLAVGAPEYATSIVASGAAYVFLRPATGWANATETQKVTGTVMSMYARSLALSDNATVLAIGAANENPSGGPASFIGSAHVLARRTNPGAPDSYVAVSKLIPSDGIPYDLFGYSVSASGDGRTIVVGAPVMEDDTPPHAGAAYVFVRPSNGWGVPQYTMTQTAKLTASDGWANDELGQSVDISVDGNTIMASAIQVPQLPGTVPGPGAAYLFARPPAGWSTATENAKVFSVDGFNYIEDLFAFSTALSGDGRVAVAGAPFQTIDANTWQGAAYIFTGTAADPVASVSPSSLTFAPQSVGTTSTSKTVTMTNTGASPLHVTGVGTTGPFTTSQNCVAASPIAPGGSCSESVAFAPQSLGQAIGTVQFTDDSGGLPGASQFVQLQGTGKKANTTTTIQSVSANPVIVGQPMIVGFSVAPEPGSTFAPFGFVTVQASTGESCTAGIQAGSCTLTFSTAVNRTITATYNGNATFNPSSSAAASIRVVDFAVSASPSSQTLVGKKATYTITVTAVNGLKGPVFLGCIGGPPNSTCAVSPNPVNVSGPTATSKATVTVPAGVSSGTYVLTFTASFGNVTRSTTASLIVR